MKINKKILFLLISLVAVFSLVACGNEKQSKDIEDSPVVGEVEGDIKDQEYNVVIEHEYGKVELKEIPEKVIVFDYGILDAIEEMGYGDHIVGLPKKSVPDYLEKYKEESYVDVGTLQEPNFEKIFELEPDLMIISARQAKLYEEFNEIGNTIYMAIDGGDYMNSFKENLNILGKIFNDEDNINERIAQLDKKIQELHAKANESDNTGLFVMANDGELRAYGIGSRFGVLYDEFGIKPVDENIESSTHGQKISFEYILEKNPDYLFIMDRSVIAGGDVSAKQTLDNDIIKSTKAYTEGNIVYLDSPTWYVASGGIKATEKMIEDVETIFEK
ncbi:MAG: siderophore ABC transporter substrate-binding protein [Tissierellaceae bacterium]